MSALKPRPATRLALRVAFGALLALQLPAPAATTVAQAEELMHQSGLWTQMATAADQFRMTVDQAMREKGVGLTPEQLSLLAPRLEQRITAQALRPRVAARLAAALQPDELPAYAAWFDSAAGQRVVALEQKAEAEAARTDVDPERPGKAWAAASAARQDLLEQIVERSRAVDLQMNLFNEITPALRRLAIALDPATPRAPEAELRVEMARYTGDMPRAMQRMLVMEYALRYQDLQDDDLRAWARFLATPAGVRLTEATLQTGVLVPLELIAELARPGP